MIVSAENLDRKPKEVDRLDRNSFVIYNTLDRMSEVADILGGRQL